MAPSQIEDLGPRSDLPEVQHSSSKNHYLSTHSSYFISEKGILDGDIFSFLR